MRKTASELVVEALKIAEKNIVFQSKHYVIFGYEPEDLAQICRIAVFKSMKRYDKNKSSINTYVSMVVRGCLNNLYRESKSRKSINQRVYGLNHHIEDTLEDKQWMAHFVSFLNNEDKFFH